MADIKVKYPSTSSTAITCTFASLATDANLLAGRASTAVDNTTNVDLDHLVSGVIRVHSVAPTVNTSIEVWAYAPISEASGTPTYPDSITGTDANKTITNTGVKFGALRLVASITVAATTSVDYPFAPVSIRDLFGSMPRWWGLFVVQNTGQILNAAQVALQYTRVQAQTV